ncbi:U3-containing 90S pre-ribosomal complex subunit-domain containing protein [Geopyxis carbonaria]|nr:U3-containing 90S pre-ribosomal complex subunit-domain containing protein [Geopyxis carbonaria]
MTTDTETAPPPIANAAPAAGESASSKRKRKREKEKANKKTKPAESTPTTSSSTTKPTKPSAGTGSNAVAARKPRAPKPRAPKPTKPARPETVNQAVAQLDPALAADYLLQRMRRFNPDVSAVELADRAISTSAFVDTTPWTEPRVEANLAAFLETYAAKKPETMKMDAAVTETGAPHTIVIAAAALRAAELARALRRFQSKEVAVAKLFAKHIKLDEAIAGCGTARMGVGVGTPGRVLDLVRCGALKTGALCRIVLDVSVVNEKQQGLLDIKETLQGLLDLLNEPGIKSRLGEGVDILVY